MPAKEFAGSVSQLDFFRDNVSQKPYCSNDLALGLRIRSQVTALNCRYIQPNHPNSTLYLVYDVDRALCVDQIVNDLDLPMPQIFVQNPDNLHAHVFYTLETPVHRNRNSSTKALRFAAAVDCAFTQALDADAQYAALIAKNPLHEHWRTFSGTFPCYTLELMSEYVDLQPYNDRRRRMPESGLGRNVNLFDRLRHWSYKAIRQGWPEFDQWHQACIDRATGYNQSTNPLPRSEVLSTAKSVAKWTHRNMSAEGFSELQTVRGAKKGQAVRDAKLDRAIELAGAGWSQRMIASELGVGQSTIDRWLRASKVTRSHIR